VGPALDPLPFGGDEEALDPHVWLDPLRVAQGARLIAAELGALDPGRDWGAAAEAYAAQAADAHDQIREILAGVAERTLVTNHDSLGYFADRYGFRVVGVVIPGGSTLAEPSSADLAALAATMRDAGVTAIFAETTDAATLAEAVAAEVGNDVAVVTLHTGSLGPPGTAAASLLGMLVDDARRIAGTLP
jgi:zinc/manganese transport system substrate-binding protein